MDYLKTHTIFNHTLGHPRQRRAFRRAPVVLESQLFTVVNRLFFMVNSVLAIALVYYFISYASLHYTAASTERADTKPVMCTEGLVAQCEVLAFPDSYHIDMVIASALDVIAAEDTAHFRAQSQAFYALLKGYEEKREGLGRLALPFYENHLRAAAGDVLSIIGTEDV